MPLAAVSLSQKRNPASVLLTGPQLNLFDIRSDQTWLSKIPLTGIITMLPDKVDESTANSVASRPPISKHLTRAVIVKSTPPRCRLYGPLFEKAESGFVEMKLTDLLSFNRVTRNFIVQAFTMPPASWSHRDVWESVRRRIVKYAARIEAPSQKGGRRRGHN